jgi:peptidoglycan-associated lipoprotein
MRGRKTAKSAIFALLLVLTVAGCKKKTAPVVQAPPPPPPSPTASISANPTNVNRGEAVQLTWRTNNATEVSIDGIGTVDPNGSRTVNPDASTSYRLVAKGPGGQQDATTRVTVNVPAPVAPAQQEVSLTDEQWFAQTIKPIYFDYDSAEIRADQQSVISANAAGLNSKQNLRIRIEGHADERGSTEYNLSLADERANAVKNALVSAGVNAGRITTISYGKEKPFCTEATEACWQSNRRGHIVLQK